MKVSQGARLNTFKTVIIATALLFSYHLGSMNNSKAVKVEIITQSLPTISVPTIPPTFPKGFKD